MNKPTVLQILKSIDYSHHGVHVIEEYRSGSNKLNSSESSVSRIQHSACNVNSLIKHLDDVILNYQIDHIDYSIKEDTWKIHVLFYTNEITEKGEKEDK